ncbi:MAG: DUF6325 family protein [Solirubrobacteraceae bacterium]
MAGWPGGHVTGEGFRLLLDLVDHGIIRVLDLEFIAKAADGTVRKVALGEVEHGGEVDVTMWEGASSGLLDQSDVDEVAAAIEPGSLAGILVYENVLAVPMWTALDRIRPAPTSRDLAARLTSALRRCRHSRRVESRCSADPFGTAARARGPPRDTPVSRLSELQERPRVDRRLPAQVLATMRKVARLEAGVSASTGQRPLSRLRGSPQHLHGMPGKARPADSTTLSSRPSRCCARSFTLLGGTPAGAQLTKPWVRVPCDHWRAMVSHLAKGAWRVLLSV